MEYTKKILDDYLNKLMSERFSTEVAIVNNEKNLEKINGDKRAAQKRAKKVALNLKDLEDQKKEGFRDKELKEQNKTLIAVLRDDLQKRNERLNSLEGQKQQTEKNIELYKNYIETIDSSVEIAKGMVSV